MFRLCLAASLAATLVSVCSGQSGTKQEQPPNIVIIFVDDLGYADIGPFGDTAYPTPNLDAMAAGGRTFTDFVASSAVCSASRAALLTGCNHTRLGISGALMPRSNEGLNPDEMTLAECVKQEGYAMACFGKWHLGHHKKFGSFGNLVVSCCPLGVHQAILLMPKVLDASFAQLTKREQRRGLEEPLKVGATGVGRVLSRTA